MTDASTAARPNAKLPLADLEAGIRNQNAIIANAKAQIATLQTEIDARLGDSVKRAYEQADKQHGTLTLELQDGLKAKADVSKTVKWDSGVLMDIASNLSWDRVSALFKVEFSMSETVYKGIAAADPDLKKKVDKARLVKFGEPKITLVRDQVDA